MTGVIGLAIGCGAVGAAVTSALLGDDITEALGVGKKYARGATLGASIAAPFGLGPAGLLAGAILGGTSAILSENEDGDAPASRSLVTLGGDM